ncbi:hypothetical protein N9A57_01190 [Candidatus Pelagibacter sp.]|nr:hypothetical protein [Candidatus Pelagibacter sp.]
MKKIKKNYTKKKPLKKKKVKKIKNKKQKKNLKVKKNFSNKKKKIKNIKVVKKNKKVNTKKKATLISRIVTLQNFLKPEFNFRVNFSLEKYIQAFFDGIANKIYEYKIFKVVERRKRQLEEIEKKEKEKLQAQKQKAKENEEQTKLREKALKEEIKLEKERTRDIKLFLRKEQALLRIEQSERQKQFLKQLQLEKQIEKFRIREVKELEKLEKISLKEKRDDYVGLQARIEKLKDKYRIIRDQKIRERVEALGIKIQGNEDRETLLQKEKDYKIAREKIELSLESFYRSASSLVFQLNKRHITRHMSIFRCIDQRFETGEIFIKWDEAPDDEWLLLIYIKDNSPDEGIVIEDKSDSEKNSSHDFKSNEIFKASDLMVDSLTQLISRTRAKKD